MRLHLSLVLSIAGCALCAPLAAQAGWKKPAVPEPTLEADLATLRAGKSPDLARVMWRLAGHGAKAKEAIPLVAEYLGHPKLRNYASRALSRFGELAIPALCACLEKEPRGSTAARSAWFGLMRMKERAAPALPRLRKWVAKQPGAASDFLQLLRQIGPTGHATIVSLLEDPKHDMAVITQIGFLRGEDMSLIVAALFKKLGSKRLTGQALQALRTLAQRRKPTDKSAVAPWVRGAGDALAHENGQVRAFCARLLADFGGAAEAATDALVKALEFDDDATWLSAARALARAVPASGLREQMDRHRDDPVRRERLAVALGYVRPGAIEDLALLLGDESARVRGHASTALYRLGDRAVPRLVRCLQSEDARVVRAAIGTLGRHAALPKAALERLQELSKSEDTHVASPARRALERVQGRTK